MLLVDILGKGIPENLHELALPDSYGCNGYKVYRDDKEILGSPVFVSSVVAVHERASTSNHTVFNLVAFVFGCEWIEFEIASADLFDARKCTRILSEYGILVTTNHARSVVRYFQEFIQENLGMLPKIQKYRFTGWYRERFLLPNRELDTIVDSGFACQYLENCGDVKLLGSIVRRAWQYNGARLLMDLSLAPILLKKCGVRNFAVNVFGRSGGGKTAAMRLAAALWGSQMFMTEFNATVNAIENFALERNDLPTLVNEWQVTDRSNRKQISNSIIHRFGEGRSKARLSKTSESQIVKEFRSILICTAEEPMINTESIQGVRARCLDLEFTPVLGTLYESKMFVDLELCREIYDVTSDNYGYIARDFINHIIREKIDWKQEFINWNETVLALRSDVLPAHAQYLALIAMIDYRFQKLYIDERATVDEVEKSVVGLVGFLLSMLPSKNSQIDSERALEIVTDWIIENQTKFQKNVMDSVPSPYYGFKKDQTWYIVPRVLRDLLFSEGFDYIKIFKEWFRSGLISYDSCQECYGKRSIDYRGNRSIFIDIKL